MGAFINLTGQRFERLTVVNKSHQAKDGGFIWECICDCGNKKFVKSGNLRSGHTLSCGCLMKERISDTQSIHRMSHQRLYNVWTSMKARCYNPNSTFYKDYGGRGIVICDEWKDNYSAFEKWAMNHGYDVNAPRGKCTIDRINNDGNYCPENCRWVDMMVQRHNQRR